jgi:hypothetical protein
MRSVATGATRSHPNATRDTTKPTPLPVGFMYLSAVGRALLRVKRGSCSAQNARWVVVQNGRDAYGRAELACWRDVEPDANRHMND